MKRGTGLFDTCNCQSKTCKYRKKDYKEQKEFIRTREKERFKKELEDERR